MNREPDLLPDEAEVPRNIRVTLEALLSVGVDSREFAPAVRNRRTGEIIDGNHRLEADVTWPVIEVDLDLVTERIVRLILNWNRRGVEEPEMIESLSFIAEQTGWSGYQISVRTGIPKATVYRYLPNKYKDEKFDSTKNHAPASMVSNETISEIQEVTVKAEPEEVHQAWEPKIPEKLQQAFKSLEPRSSLEDDEVLALEELPEESLEETEQVERKGDSVNVILPQEEETLEQKTPRQIALDIYARFGSTSDTFVQTAIRKEHPELTEEEITKVIRQTKPDEPSRVQLSLGVACPICSTWKTTVNFQRTLKELEKKDPELALLTRERVKRQGVTL